MATRLVHLSDLHFPAAQPAQAEALAQSIAAARPDVVAITGDLTRRGRRHEFEAAARLVDALPGEVIVVPGNHDVPLVKHRFSRPFARFAAYFPGQPLYIETSDILLAGLNTAVGARLTALDWSLGDAPRERVAPVALLLREFGRGRLGIVACHHPLRRHALDQQRSVTRRGPEAFAELAASGMRLLLHGHLHRSSSTCLDASGVAVCEVCANTALSDRERSGPAAYNVIDVENGAWRLTVMRWNADRYEASDEALKPQPAG
jgi:3',5'-cyclic AMP phosphodiesterase CpdA